MNLQPYQFIVAALALVMIVFGVEQYLKGGKGQTVLKLLVRLTVWGGMLVISVFPRITYDIARLLGVEGNVNAVMMIAFLLVFLLIFKILSVIERIEHQITLLTREQALRELRRDERVGKN
jgi:hypothetical protein